MPVNLRSYKVRMPVMVVVGQVAPWMLVNVGLGIPKIRWVVPEVPVQVAWVRVWVGQARSYHEGED